MIVVGMHRSGTSLLSGILERCGFFMGREQTQNRESVFFQDLNREILDLFGCSWRCPDFLPPVAELSQPSAWLKDFMTARLDREMISGHFGIHFLKALGTQPFLWGWKDPRNSLLLPVWKTFFPYAKILHIRREGRAVALSLLAREIRREKGQKLFDLEKKKKIYSAHLALREAYLQRIREGMALFEATCTLQYENLLADPESEIEKVLTSLKIPKKEVPRDALALINPENTNKYEGSEFSWARELPGA